jgi:hypothetical protein
MNELLSYLQMPILKVVFASFGIGAFTRELAAFLLKAIAILSTPQGQKEIKDVKALADDFAQAAVDAGHPEPKQVNSVVNDILNELPVSKSTKALVMLLGFLALGAGVHATTLSLGPISISPTAGPLNVVVQPFTGASFWRMGAGVVLHQEDDVIGGVQVMMMSGPYGFGIATGADEDVSNGTMYGIVGVAAEIVPWGEALVVWRNSGALLALTVPWQLGGNIQP